MEEKYLFAVIDVDGFNLHGTMVPRELGMSVFCPDRPKSDNQTQGVYFNGGMNDYDVYRNMSNISYVQKKIHGMPVIFDLEFETVELSPRTTWQKIFREKLSVWRNGDGQFENRTVYIFHKGGLEGKELLSVDSVESGKIIDLNTFSCPKTGNLPEPHRRFCSPKVHNLLDKKYKWTDHCPQNEVQRLAEWVYDNLRVRGGAIVRDPNIDEGELADMISNMMLSDNAPKSGSAAFNMLKQKMLKAEKYTTPIIIASELGKIFD